MLLQETDCHIGDTFRVISFSKHKQKSRGDNLINLHDFYLLSSTIVLSLSMHSAQTFLLLSSNVFSVLPQITQPDL